MLCSQHHTRERKMEFFKSLIIKLLVVQWLSALCLAEDFDSFYFVLQWPGSFCDTKQSCCIPTTGKLEPDFGIHGLWPSNNDGSKPSNCNPSSRYVPSKMSDLISRLRESWPSLACSGQDDSSFWSHEWEKYGTCSESVLNQHSYFKSALNLKAKVELAKILEGAGIRPDGGSYSLSSINGAIKQSIGYTSGIECNVDEAGNSQLFRVFICVDTSGSNFIECPVLPTGKCASTIIFPAFFFAPA